MARFLCCGLSFQCVARNSGLQPGGRRAESMEGGSGDDVDTDTDLEPQVEKEEMYLAELQVTILPQ